MRRSRLHRYKRTELPPRFQRIVRDGKPHRCDYKSASLADTWSRYRWLQANLIVHRVPQTLLAAKVTLRRLNAHVTELELDLLQFSSSFMTQASAGAP